MRTLCIATAIFVTSWAVAAAQPPDRPPSRIPSDDPTIPAAEPPSTQLSTRQPESVPAEAPQPQERLSLHKCEELALGNHPALARAAAGIQMARGQWVQEGLYPNPKFGYEGGEMGNGGRSGMQGGFVGQEIVTGGKLRLNRAAAAQEIREAEQQLEAERYRVINNVRLRFYDVLLAQRTIDLTMELDRIGAESLKTAEGLFKVKESALSEVLQARIEANTAKIALRNARNAHTSAWQRLAAAVAIPDMRPVALEGSLEFDRKELTWEVALGELLASSPQLTAAQARIGRAGWAVQRARAEPIPNLDLEGSVQFDNESSDTVASVRVGIPLPLWNRNQGGILRAQGGLAAAQSEVQQIELELTNRLAQAFERYANARYQVELYTKQILPDAKQSLDIVQKGYSAGEYGFLSLLLAQRTYVETNLMYIESLRQLRGEEVAIEGLLLISEAGGEMK